MERVESIFRRVEGVLDELLKKDDERLRSAGLVIEDHSGRTYHYKNDHLSWSQVIRKEWRVDLQRARVTVTLYYGEPAQPDELPTLTVTWRAELFQQGQESSIDKRGTFARSLQDVQQEGVAPVIDTAIAQGAACLPAGRP